MAKARVLTQLIDGPERAAFEARMRAEGLYPITVFTDGSCPENAVAPGTAPIGLGVLAVYGKRRREWSVPAGLGTNQIAELQAVRLGLACILAKQEVGVRVYCDSEYAIGSISKAWRPRANQELIAECRAVYNEFTCIELVHIHGHAGVEGNERSDVLAATAVRTGQIWTGLVENGRRVRGDPADSPLNAWPGG